MTVAIDAQIVPDQDGSIQPVLIGLVRGLAELEPEGVDYLIIRRWGEPEWLAPYVARHQRIVCGPPQPGTPFEQAKRLLGPARAPLGYLWRATRRAVRKVPARSSPPPIAVSDGFYERLSCDVLHVTYPLHFVRAKVPTVFTVYDLQHRHYPAYFPPELLAWREKMYPIALAHADAVVTISEFVRSDLIRQYGVDPKKVHVVALAAPTAAYSPVPDEAIEAANRKFRLPSWFALYPAMTYEHKNHIRLLEALARLRDERSVTVPLVCTGLLTRFWCVLQPHIRRLRLQRQVHFIGYVNPLELRALYRRSRFVVFPSLFEGAGLPVLEAFHEGVPVACSDIPALREYAGDAALFFEPASVESIATAIDRVSSDGGLRKRLRERGVRRSTRFTWERTARGYRAVYRLVAGARASDDAAFIEGGEVCGARETSRA